MTELTKTLEHMTEAQRMNEEVHQLWEPRQPTTNTLITRVERNRHALPLYHPQPDRLYMPSLRAPGREFLVFHGGITIK